MSDINSLIKMINKDFEVADGLSEERLRELMVNSFAYLIEEDFSKLLQDPV
ncbi:hypothetical protein [Pedobacter sp. UC225_65]|uniref:hypothetical protein n=1 Tax=Pedobacter sp. UC225_65 TaxID=3350173 RepID=UPI00366A6890